MLGKGCFCLPDLCAIWKYTIAIKFLSDLWVDMEATAASKDASISQGPAEEALLADSAAAATVMSAPPMPAPKTRPRLQAHDSKEERYKEMCNGTPSRGKEIFMSERKKRSIPLIGGGGSHPDSSSPFIGLGMGEFNFESFGSQRRSDRGFWRRC